MLKYCAAYGRNLNEERTRKRCPGSEIVDAIVIRDYELLYCMLTIPAEFEPVPL